MHVVYTSSYVSQTSITRHHQLKRPQLVLGGQLVVDSLTARRLLAPITRRNCYVTLDKDLHTSVKSAGSHTSSFFQKIIMSASAYVKISSFNQMYVVYTYTSITRPHTSNILMLLILVITRHHTSATNQHTSANYPVPVRVTTR